MYTHVFVFNLQCTHYCYTTDMDPLFSFRFAILGQTNFDDIFDHPTSYPHPQYSLSFKTLPNTASVQYVFKNFHIWGILYHAHVLKVKKDIKIEAGGANFVFNILKIRISCCLKSTQPGSCDNGSAGKVPATRAQVQTLRTNGKKKKKKQTDMVVSSCISSLGGCTEIGRCWQFPHQPNYLNKWSPVSERDIDSENRYRAKRKPNINL